MFDSINSISTRYTKKKNNNNMRNEYSTNDNSLLTLSMQSESWMYVEYL